MEKEMKIFCDLDGTLIDVTSRHYRVYSETIAEFNGTPLSKDAYWNLKRQKTKWDEILRLSHVSSTIEAEFLLRFIDKIEDPQYLKMDTLLPGAVETLESLLKIGECYLVTLRRNRENVLEELDLLDLKKHFTEVLTGHSENDGYDVKIALIKDKLLDERGVIIGDTEADIMAGKELGLKTFAVTSGIRDEVFLAAMEPDYVVSSIDKVPELLK